ncbi:MAG TPA: SPOR domain-containing protein [Flavipsychrobacter sp.]|nr:SPOR domain-containing protein [Flavipsychrobacter sp.]
MKILVSIFVIVVVCLTGNMVMAQEEASDSSGVIIHADPRLAMVTAFMKPKSYGTNSSGRSGVIRSGRGFRVQIYNGNDRNKAISTKVDFMRRHPNVPTYMSYIQPQFRVKVGNFRSRGDAQKFVQQISANYSPVMVVPDIIVINTFKDDHQYYKAEN